MVGVSNSSLQSIPYKLDRIGHSKQALIAHCFSSTGITLALEIQANSPSTSLKDFKTTAATEHFSNLLKQNQREVEAFAKAFPMPGN